MVNIDKQYKKIIDNFDRSWRVNDDQRIDRLRRVFYFFEKERMSEKEYRSPKVIHIAGTNGKGSVGAMLSSLLIAAGFKVGHFSSPYVFDDLEQIKINDKIVSRQQFVDSFQHLYHKTLKRRMNEQTFSYFEWMTFIALDIFGHEQVDYVILESGLGGRDDATNVIKNPKMAILTQISIDHADILGHTISQITEKKVDVVKPKSLVVMDHQLSTTAKKIVLDKIKKVGAILSDVKEPKISVKRSDYTGLSLTIDNKLNVNLDLLGNYQADNVAIAYKSLMTLSKSDGFEISNKQIQTGFKNAHIIGRLYFDKKNRIVYSSAHNLGGFQALAKTIKTWKLKSKPILIIGILADKEYKQMVREITPLTNSIITVTPDSPRAISAQELAAEIMFEFDSVQVDIADDATAAIGLAKFELRPDSVIIVAGSIYAIRALQKETSNGNG